MPARRARWRWAAAQQRRNELRLEADDRQAQRSDERSDAMTRETAPTSRVSTAARWGSAQLDRITRRQLAAWAAAMALLGWVLMTIGAFVRASESGLGCPDWPACHSQLIASGHHAMIEEIHRWVAAVLVVGVVGLAAMVLRGHHRERRLTGPLAWMLGMLALQVILGGVTVLLRNVSWTVVAHYGGAALLVGSITLVAVRLAFPTVEPAPHDSFSRLIGWFVALSYGLLLAGSTLANAGSDGACGRGFPLCNGSLFPSLDHLVVIALIHRVWAGALLVLALWVLFRSRRDRAGAAPIKWAALVVAILYVVQAGLGVVIVGVSHSVATEVLHSSIGSLTSLALATLLWLTWTLAREPDTSKPR
ncbi:MAG: COX15/CtaA family protein [Solirubrobacteraceae bacterium]